MSSGFSPAAMEFLDSNVIGVLNRDRSLAMQEQPTLLMEFDVATLAQRSGLTVDTIRYYQGLGLLDPPRREGRTAVYDSGHLERLERIRTLAERGFSLKAIGSLLEAGDASESDRRLLEAVTHEGPHYVLTDELAARLAPASHLVGGKAGLPRGSSDRKDPRPTTTRVAGAPSLEYGFPLVSSMSGRPLVRRVVDPPSILRRPRPQARRDVG
jgi:DNA-binding transcriptional MerR regulator